MESVLAQSMRRASLHRIELRGRHPQDESRDGRRAMLRPARLMRFFLPPQFSRAPVAWPIRPGYLEGWQRSLTLIERYAKIAIL